MVLQRYGMLGDFLRAIRAIYQASEACVRVEGEVTEWFVQGEAGREAVLPYVTMVIQHLPRYSGQRSMRQFPGRSDIEYMQGAKTVVCG